MSWLDRINDRETRRTVRHLIRSGSQMRDLAQDQMQRLGRDTRDLARSQAQQLARQAGSLAGEAGHQLAEYGRHEGVVLAQATARQALRAGRAMRADPVPAIVGAVGLALFASLLLSRRRS